MVGTDDSIENVEIATSGKYPRRFVPTVTPPWSSPCTSSPNSTYGKVRSGALTESRRWRNSAGMSNDSAAIFCSSCLTLVAPIRTEATPGRFATQLSDFRHAAVDSLRDCIELGDD